VLLVEAEAILKHRRNKRPKAKEEKEMGKKRREDKDEREEIIAGGERGIDWIIEKKKRGLSAVQLGELSWEDSLNKLPGPSFRGSGLT